MTGTSAPLNDRSEESMDNAPKCEKCELDITTGLMAGLCQYARQCPMWPHATRGDCEEMGGELFMAHVWMDNACKQIGLQIDERKRLEAEAERLREMVRYSDQELRHAFGPLDEGAPLEAIVRKACSRFKEAVSGLSDVTRERDSLGLLLKQAGEEIELLRHEDKYRDGR